MRYQYAAVLRLLILLLALITAPKLLAQRLQGGFHFGLNRSLLTDLKTTGFDPSSMKFEEGYGMLAGIAFNYSPSGSNFYVNSGIYFEDKQLSFTQELNLIQGLSGLIYNKLKYRDYGLPLVLGYGIPFGGVGFRLVPKAGIFLNYGGVRLSTIGYKDLNYTGTDSLFFDIGGLPDFKKEFRIDPCAAISFLWQPQTERIFEIILGYRYSINAYPGGTIYSMFRNSVQKSNSSVSFMPQLSSASLSIVFYPGWFAFKKRGPLQDEEDED